MPKTMTMQQVSEAAALVTGRSDWSPVGRQADESLRRRVAAFARLKSAAQSGNLAARVAVQEAMATDDYPLILGDTLGREMREKYRAWPSVWEGVAQRRIVNDFRTVKSFAPYSLNGVMSKVGSFGGNTEARSIADRSPVEYKVERYEVYAPVNRDAIINDDIGQFAGIPQDFAEAARQTESKEFTQAFTASDGPTNVTALTGNPVFGVLGFKAAMKQIMETVDPASGIPIVLTAPILMVPPALAIDAREVVKASMIELISSASSTDRRLTTENWIGEMVNRIVVNPWISILQDTNKTTTWYLFAQPSPGRAAVEAAFLRGFEQPGVFVKASDKQNVGGGMAPVTQGQFNDPNIHYKCEHVFAFKAVAALYAYGSKGTGS